MCSPAAACVGGFADLLRCCVTTLIIRHPRLLLPSPSHDTPSHWEKLWICQKLCDHNEAGLGWVALDTGVKFDPNLLLVAETAAGRCNNPATTGDSVPLNFRPPFGALKKTHHLAQHNQNQATICHFVHDGFYIFHASLPQSPVRIASGGVAPSSNQIQDRL